MKNIEIGDVLENGLDIRSKWIVYLKVDNEVHLVLSSKLQQRLIITSMNGWSLVKAAATR
jgi:hypothetical protein